MFPGRHNHDCKEQNVAAHLTLRSKVRLQELLLCRWSRISTLFMEPKVHYRVHKISGHILYSGWKIFDEICMCE
jgi:hypothetical protein